MHTPPILRPAMEKVVDSTIDKIKAEKVLPERRSVIFVQKYS